MKIFLILSIFTLSFYAKSTEFSLVIDKNFDNTLTGITQNYDRTLSAVGVVLQTKERGVKKRKSYTDAFEYLASLSSDHGPQIEFVKVDDKARIIAQKSIPLQGFHKAVGILKSTQDGYFIGGNGNDGSCTLVKLDADARVLFEKKFTTSHRDTLNKIIKLRDGGILAIATSLNSASENPLFHNGLSRNDIYLARFSQEGRLIWEKILGTYRDDQAVDAVEADDGSILLLGQIRNKEHSNAFLARVTDRGEKIWLEEYTHEKGLVPHKITKLQEGTFAISLSQYDDRNKKQVRLMKVDLQKNILLDKLVYTAYATVLKDIKELSDSRIVGVGYVQDRFDTDGVAMLFDNKLNLLLQEHYGGKGHDGFSALEILHNSQIAAAGFYTKKNAQERNMWLMKLNEDLSVAQTSKSTAQIAKELETLFAREIKEGKIKLKKDLRIELADKDLLFQVAQYKLSDKQKKFLQKFGTKLLAYLYKNRQRVQSIEVNGHTSSEWGTQDFTQRYLKNADLSMKRSFAAWSYLFVEQKTEIRKWLAHVVKGSGLSFSKKIMHGKKEQKEASRRVSFKVLLL